MFISELPTLLTHCMQFWSYKLRIHPCGISKQRKTTYCSLTVDNPTDKMREETLHIGKRFSVGDLEPWHCLGLGWLGNRLSSATHDGTRSCRTSVILFTVQRKRRCPSGCHAIPCIWSLCVKSCKQHGTTYQLGAVEYHCMYLIGRSNLVPWIRQVALLVNCLGGEWE